MVVHDQIIPVFIHGSPNTLTGFEKIQKTVVSVKIDGLT